ncbi:MAG TPA: sigma-70 family RNA polymerase sigma factor [Candidatus Babeliales bacterium]|jgi:RNA polymerase sigma factor (TIGR02999 family)|nr:sigma-70 family RNA polymerase sigma factor [Candidatus Babeliales bacterium]
MLSKKAVGRVLDDNDHKSAGVSPDLDRQYEAFVAMLTSVSQKQQVTQLLCEWRDGDSHALEKLIPLVQPELQRLAQHYMSRERAGHTLQTTALLDDAYLQLADKTHPQWQNRAHFFAVAAQLMRRIMVDHARRRQALKRGSGAMKITLDECAVAAETRAAELLALDEALEKLASADPRKARVVEMRYFGGLTMQEIADVLKIHVNTVTRDWIAARAWLFAELSGEDMDAV